MITLQSIRVRNFRAIKEATFKPLEEGITGIFGSNGAGKTTFLTATLFALYGVKPPGASQNSLRRIGSKNEESSVSVVFTHMGQQVEIIRELKAPNNRIIVNIYVDGVPQTVTSVGAADAWVKARLGIDANGFMTAFVVRQKELDQLVNAKPAERKAIIERLAGIDTINIALKAARENENQAKKTLATMQGSEADVDAASEALDLTTRRLDKISGEKEELSLKINILDTKLSGLKKKAEAIKNDELEIQKLNTQIEMIEPQLVSTKAEIASLPETVEEELTIEELRELLRSTKTEIAELTEKYNQKNAEYMSANTTFSSATKEVAGLESKLSAFAPKPDIKKDYKVLAEEKTKLIEVTRDEIATFKSKLADLNESLKSLDHAENCPTCQQSLANPKAIIDGIKELVKSNETGLDKSEKALEKARFDLAEYTSLDKTQGEYKAVQKALEASQKALEALPSMDGLTVEIEALKTDLDAKNALHDEVIERGTRLKESLSVEETRSSLVNKLSALQKNFADSEQALNSLTAKIGGTQVLAELSGINKLESEVAVYRGELADLVSTLGAIEQRIGGERIAYKVAKETWERKSELLKKQQQVALTTDVIESFRSETIAALAPELSETATSLISEMTNGDFTEIRLDDEFNPSVIDSSGIERPVSWLSGGEESAVALSLRLAIAFLITGGDPQLLWLDEVLTAQDADRRNTMLSMIRRLPINQIIMINHTQEAGDIVDKAIEIIPNLQEGSSIKEDSLDIDEINTESADSI